MGLVPYRDDSPDHASDPGQIEAWRRRARSRSLQATMAKAGFVLLSACATLKCLSMMGSLLERLSAGLSTPGVYADDPGPSLGLGGTLAPLLVVFILVILGGILRAVATSLDRQPPVPATAVIPLEAKAPFARGITIVRAARRDALAAREHLRALGDAELADRVSLSLRGLDEAVWAMAQAATTSNAPEVIAGLESRAGVVAEAAASLGDIRATMEAAADREARKRAEDAAAGAMAHAATMLEAADDLLVSASQEFAALAVAREEAFGEPTLP